MRILAINGPNMNLLGVRQPEIYGKTDYNSLVSMLEAEAKRLNVELRCFQSNHEGALVDAIQQAYLTAWTALSSIPPPIRIPA